MGKHSKPGGPDRKLSKGGGRHEKPGTHCVEEILRQDAQGDQQGVSPDALARIWAKIMHRKREDRN